MQRRVRAAAALLLLLVLGLLSLLQQCAPVAR